MFPEPLSRLNFLQQTPSVPTPTDSDSVACKKKEEESRRRRTFKGKQLSLTINCSLSGAKCAIPVKGSTTGKDAAGRKKLTVLRQRG